MVKQRGWMRRILVGLGWAIGLFLVLNLLLVAVPYLIAAGDVGFTIRSQVTAVNAGGPSLPASSINSSIKS